MAAERLCSRVPPLMSHEVFSLGKAASAIRLLADESVSCGASRHAGHVEANIPIDCITIPLLDQPASMARAVASHARIARRWSEEKIRSKVYATSNDYFIRSAYMERWLNVVIICFRGCNLNSSQKDRASPEIPSMCNATLLLLYFFYEITC